MDRQQLSHSRSLGPQLAPRTSWRNRLWRIVFSTSLFLSGMAFGIIALLFSAVAISGSRPVLPTTPFSHKSDLLIQAGNQYITHLVQKNLQTSGLVNASNVAVTMAQGGIASS